jgi:chemotaxis family two-component system response regulator Rcp1
MTGEATSREPVEILLVEDNPVDVLVTEEALQDNSHHIRLTVLDDGKEALDYLYRRGKYCDATRPGLILLDLNVPKKDGREILEEIKQDSLLLAIPVIILTTSESEVDISKSYELHANCFVTKPAQFDQYLKVVKSIVEFWVTIAKLPLRS